MTRSKDYQASATAAYLKGLQDSQNGLFWLRRAKRLAPDDPRIELEIARRELSLGQDGAKRAYQSFLSLAEKYDFAPAWIGLAIASQIVNDAANAAKAIDKVLRQHCFPSDPSFPGFARHVALAAGYDGYQGQMADASPVSEGKGRLLGIAPDLKAISRVEGLVEWKKNGLSGWAVRPAWPYQPPRLTLTDANGQMIPVKFGKPLPFDAASPFLPRYRFRFATDRIKHLQPPFSLIGPDGKSIMGSPIDPRPLCQSPTDATRDGQAPESIPRPVPLALIMPVYRGLVETQAAIHSVLKGASVRLRLIVVNDASPEPLLVQWLEAMASNKKIELINHSKNLGFCAAANTGLAAAKGDDVVLLNSDILVPPGAIETLREVAYSSASVGTVTPFSNEATICSYPDVNAVNPMPDFATTKLFNRLAKATNGLANVEIPTAVGFCMYIRHDCLAATGNFRTEIFAQGYGEENDFCLRARHLGYIHVMATGAYVAHKGGVSFQSAARGLSRRNQEILNKLFPDYQALIEDHMVRDPIAPYRAMLDEARLCHERRGRKSVLMISHALGGGVAKQVEHSTAALRELGLNPLLLTAQFPKNSSRTKYPWPSLLCAGVAKDYPNLAFNLPQDAPKLLVLLRRLETIRLELHHSLGQHESVRKIAAMLGVPQDIITHDYASFCPRVNLLTRPSADSPLRYCGEPDIKGCIKCCQQDKSGIFEALPIKQLLARSREEFNTADKIIVPSADMGRRLSRHFPGIKPQITPWEDDTRPITLSPAPPGRRRVAVIGGINPAKGLDILLKCAKDARRRQLPLEFIVIGSSADDAALLDADVRVSGPYRPEEAQLLIKSLEPDLAFVPSICPETWCFVLSEAWLAGLYAVAFDLGAQAERIRSTGRGAILPLGLSPDRINNALLSITF